MLKKIGVFLLLFVFCCARPCASSTSFEKMKTALGQTSLAPSEEERLLDLPGQGTKVMFEVTAFDEDSIKSVTSKLQEADALGQQIYLRINTNGGSTSRNVYAHSSYGTT